MKIKSAFDLADSEFHKIREEKSQVNGLPKARKERVTVSLGCFHDLYRSIDFSFLRKTGSKRARP